MLITIFLGGRNRENKTIWILTQHKCWVLFLPMLRTQVWSELMLESKEGILFLTSPVAGGHSCSPGILLKEMPEILPWPSCLPGTERGSGLQMSTRLMLNNILLWGFHCGFTICPKDEGTLLKDVWMFCYQISDKRAPLCSAGAAVGIKVFWKCCCNNSNLLLPGTSAL